MNERLQKLIAYLVAQGQQASTWRGVILVATGLSGWQLPAEKTAAVVAIGVTVAGLVGMLFPDNLKKDDTKGSP